MAEQELPKKKAAKKKAGAKKSSASKKRVKKKTPKKALAKKKVAKKTQTKNAAAHATDQTAEATITILFVEDTTGEQFECRVPASMPLSHLASDFFESQGWDTQDAHGRGQRAVVELVDPKNPDRTSRLNSEDTVDEAGLRDNDVLRIFPESVAGAVDERIRLPALIQDLNAMTELAEWNEHISFVPKPANAPTFYRVHLNYPGFCRLDGNKPIRTERHEVEIHLGADYPRQSPIVFWKSEVFHPNIHPDHRGVCLGVLMERWMPSLGIARLVTMLAEIAQWRNFDISNAFNRQAAEWASKPANMKFVSEIGGSTDQHPIGDWLKKLELESDRRERLTFTKVDKKRR